MSANFSYCIANYLCNKTNFNLSEELAFIFGGCYHLSLRKKNTGHLVDARSFSEVNDSVYISNNNNLAIQNFTSILGCVLRIEPRDSTRDLKWIIDDYFKNGHYKTLVTIPDSVLKNSLSNFKPSQNLWAIISPASEVEEDVNGASVEPILNIALCRGKSLKKDVKFILEIWNDQISNGALGPNRFKIIPPVYHNFEAVKKILLKNALTRMYLALNTNNLNTGPNIFVFLIENLKRDPSDENIAAHRKLLLEAVSNDGFQGENCMGRSYASHCFETAGLVEGMNSLMRVSDSLLVSRDIWKSALLELNSNQKNTSDKDLLEIYQKLENSEKVILENLKQTLL